MNAQFDLLNKGRFGSAHAWLRVSLFPTSAAGVFDAIPQLGDHFDAESTGRFIPARGEVTVIKLFIPMAAAPALLFAFHGEAKAWGKFGHLTICEVAYRNTTPATRVAIGSILHGGITIPAHGQTLAQHYTAFNRGCLEEDELPRRNPDDHFINLPRSQAAITDDQCPAAVAQGECIFAGIQRDLAVLRDPTKPRMDRAFALFELGHFVGDLHQPLHISFADDKGGNGIDARVTGGCGHFGYRAENLHGLWDNCILHAGTFGRVYQRADYKPTWDRFTVTYRAADTLQANTSLAQEQQIVAGDLWQWAEESYRITRDPDVRYCVIVGASCNYSPTDATKRSNTPRRSEQLDQAYLQRYDRIVEDRVRYAGFRLAHLLNQALDPAYTGPVRNSTQPQ